MNDFFDNWTVQVRKGLLELCILNSLGGQERYGYELVKTLVAIPGLGVTEGTLYPLLSRLRVQGLVSARIGAPEGATCVAEPPPARAVSGTRSAQPARKLPGWWLLILGVLLPLGAIAFEFAGGACAGLFFDPLPTLAHVLLATFVPVAN